MNAEWSHSRRPTFRAVTRSRGADVGTVVISLDAELAWGVHDLEDPPATRIERARGSWLDLIEPFEAFEIPATWAIVGHLFLEECDGGLARDVSPLVAPEHSDSTGRPRTDPVGARTPRSRRVENGTRRADDGCGRDPNDGRVRLTDTSSDIPPFPIRHSSRSQVSSTASRSVSSSPVVFWIRFVSVSYRIIPHFASFGRWV